MFLDARSEQNGYFEFSVYLDFLTDFLINYSVYF